MQGAKKEKIPRYTISGILLECSSHPVPVADFEFVLTQSDDFGLPGGVPGTEEYFKTGASGIFSVSYTPKKGSGISTGRKNNNYLSIVGVKMETAPYAYYHPDWRPISANKDTAMGTMYLYKKISSYVRTIEFKEALGSGDSLEVITASAPLNYYKYLKGPINAGTIYKDTLKPVRLELFNLNTREYRLLNVLKKPGYQKNFSSTYHEGDENMSEIKMTFP